ncbi:LapA family protein [Micromonospora sp. C51]|uniref:lipopolysaccharide assembly protein LapA domain-containing protein n=1 Tax=Micromonospora sp. C51 TaxID=2824879 RepID=UPI001B358CDA|nr:LapA family protein [Micromonospora sp. C51]MBQ1052460.1 LapA family protein [Micromonospora sp. C51]
MSRFTGSARSTNVQPGPQINDRPRPGPRVRAGGSLVAFAASAVVLLLLLIFILQNGQRTEVHFFGAQGQLPMGVALLLAAVFGVLLVTVQATVRRIIRLRLLTRRHRTTSYTTNTRPDPADTDPGTDVPEGRN